jgi:2-polyprenyl-6-methoxyphenol hydroxylase-like FAD-dependent oxidoreductase
MNDHSITKNLISDKKIAILGGGPGGLTLARLLQMNGADVKVYERDAHKDVRVQGATLDLHDESGLKALREAGLIDAFYDNYRPGADKLYVTDKNAVIVHNEDEDREDATSRPEIDRGPLRKILLDSLAPETVVWDSNFSSMEKIGEQWKITFKNTTSAMADIVIGADGANSKVRPFLTPIQPIYSGVTMVEGKVYDSETNAPQIHKLLNGGKIFALGDKKTLIISSKGDGSLVFYTGKKEEENWTRNSRINFSNKDEVRAWFEKEFSGWDAIWLELFEKCDTNFIPRPQYYMPLDQTWDAQSDLTLLGDAAHLMPPYAGEGVNMAMLDALELSQCLTSGTFPDVHSAIEEYETTMRLRASQTTQMTLEQTDSLHSANAMENLINMFTE